MANRSLRVLLISANTEKLPDPVFPISAASMAVVAAAGGQTVETLDLGSNWIVPGLGIKTNVRVLQPLRERKIKDQVWRLLR